MKIAFWLNAVSFSFCGTALLASYMVGDNERMALNGMVMLLNIMMMVKTHRKMHE